MQEVKSEKHLIAPLYVERLVFLLNHLIQNYRVNRKIYLTDLYQDLVNENNIQLIKLPCQKNKWLKLYKPYIHSNKNI
jgi:hypothetical protein